ncbi:MAG: hypothetical protein R3Y50_01110 [Rikenellaceae bacterium]
MAETKIQRVTIQSLTTTLPENIATDGTLEKLHNARYIAGGVENVSQFNTKSYIADFNGFTIIYLHKSNYIAIDSELKLHYVTSNLSNLVSLQEIDTVTDSENLKISHFGNVLYVTDSNGQRQFIFKNSAYSVVSLENIPPIDNANIEYEYIVTEAMNIVRDTPIMACNVDDNGYETDSQYNYPIAIAELHNQDYIHGAFYIIIAYRLFDGSIIKNSRAYMMESEIVSNGPRTIVNARDDDTFSDGEVYDYTYFKQLHGCKPTIKFDVSDDIINNEMISSIVVYSTIPGDIYDFVNFHKIFHENIEEDFENSLDLPASLFYEESVADYAKRPFYEIEEIFLKDIVENQVEITLTYSDHIYQMEFNDVYEASFSVHNTIHGSMMEYNSRLHTFNQQTELYKGVALSNDCDNMSDFTKRYYYMSLTPPYKIEYCVEIKIDENSYEVSSGEVDYCHIAGDSAALVDEFYIIVDNFLSYPDYRAEKINIYYNNSSDRMLIASLELTAATGNNFAYYVDTTYNCLTGRRAIKCVKTDYFSPTHALSQEHEPIISTNKIMVSEQNNPYSFDVSHTYSIESSDYEIYALSTAANQITENSYGDHPLVVFTSKGIYTLEQGSDDILYSRIILIDNREQAETIKTVSLGETIYFTSEDELLALNGRTISTHSKALERSKDRLSMDLEEFSSYVQNAHLYALVWYSEVMVYNSDYDYAYVYMINNGGWYSRLIEGKYISANIMVTPTGVLATNLREDQDIPLAPHIITNALKLGSYDLKKIEYISPIFTIPQNSNIETTVKVSNDLNNWYSVSKTRFGTKIGRFGASWRYIKIDMEYKTTSSSSYLHFFLSSIEFKFTLRYKTIVEV